MFYYHWNCYCHSLTTGALLRASVRALANNRNISPEQEVDFARLSQLWSLPGVRIASGKPHRSKPMWPRPLVQKLLLQFERNWQFNGFPIPKFIDSENCYLFHLPKQIWNDSVVDPCPRKDILHIWKQKTQEWKKILPLFCLHSILIAANWVNWTVGLYYTTATFVYID